MTDKNYSGWGIFAPLVAAAVLAGACGLANKTPETQNKRVEPESKIERIVQAEPVQEIRVQSPVQEQVQAKPQENLGERSWRDELYPTLSRYEGKKDIAYPDKGSKSVGKGFYLGNPDAKERLARLGLSYDEVYAGRQKLNDKQIETLFDEDVDKAISEAKVYLGEAEFEALDDNAKYVLSSMVFQMGEPKMTTKYVQFKKALGERDYQRAADEMEWRNGLTKRKHSDWYTQTPNRARDLIGKMRSIKSGK